MMRAILYGSGIIILIHGLIHLLGFVAYWPLAVLPELPYKTALVGGHWEVGRVGMRLYGLLWLIACLGFAVAAVGLLWQRPWWYPALWGAVILSTLLIAGDLGVAWRGALVNLVLLLWLALTLGLRILPSPFPAYHAQAGAMQRLPLPTGLPAPVERFYRTAYGESLPQIDSVVLTGRADLRFGPITFPARWRFTHQAGYGYRHYIEATFFGRPVLKVNERFLDGRIRMELPFGVVENDPKSDSAANLSLWGEGLLFPSLFLTDPRVRWEGIDASHARLIVPAGAGEDEFTVAFDPGTGLIWSMEALRWKEPSSTQKTPWHLEPLGWERVEGALLPVGFSVTWGDEEGPWLKGRVEEAIYNVEVGEYLKTTGL